MKVVRWIVGLAVFAALLLFALQNVEPVTLRFYDGVVWQTPLIFLILVVFAAGAAAGLLTGAIRSARLKRQVTRLRREQARHASQAVAPRSDGA
ncbi:MAG TPA: lipopolysaccharide assembly protein LapA domain-containing protein [Casimicrobiaceae bacterium]|nr:lipopolysaccharide assembly protein LapA domain-containing protein [Casimicrobiaceae bacterium]